MSTSATTDAHSDAHDEPAMTRALELARAAAAVGEVPVGAVVFDLATGAFVAEAANTRETQKDPAGHAEFLAIKRAAAAAGDWRLNHLGVAVTLEPCPMCAGLIINARLGRVVYGATDPKAGACDTLYQITTDPRLNHAAVVRSGLFAQEAGELLRAFFRERRR
ncbi:MAG: nucleoside deaminase [Planctomycetota bacterium]